MWQMKTASKLNNPEKSDHFNFFFAPPLHCVATTVLCAFVLYILFRGFAGSDIYSVQEEKRLVVGTALLNHFGEFMASFGCCWYPVSRTDC